MSVRTTISFHRDGGESIVLANGENGEPFHLLQGSLGLGVAPPSFASTEVPGGNGSHLRGKRLNERDVFIPVLAEATTAGEVRNQLDRLLRVVSPVDPRPLWLRVEVAGRDGYRELPVHYAGGLQGDYGVESGVYHESLGLEFKSFEVFWYGEEQTITRTVDPASKHFLSDTESFFPIILSDSTVNDQLAIHVAGDAPTFPVWTVVPPGEDLLIVHTTTGRKFLMDGILTNTLTVDMVNDRLSSPGFTEAALWARVSADSSPSFQLLPGENVLEFSLVGATSASTVHVTYRPRFLAGH